MPTVDCPVVAPQTGEDVNANGVLDCYGETPHWLGDQSTGSELAGTPAWRYQSRRCNCARHGPGRTIAAVERRAGPCEPPGAVPARAQAGQCGRGRRRQRLPADGLTVVSENPVYVQGNYNATNDPVVNATETHVPARSSPTRWRSSRTTGPTPARSDSPNNATDRQATTTGYRFAVVTGKSLSFP